jgi:hypothetical protein
MLNRAFCRKPDLVSAGEVSGRYCAVTFCRTKKNARVFTRAFIFLHCLYHALRLTKFEKQNQANRQLVVLFVDMDGLVSARSLEIAD